MRTKIVASTFIRRKTDGLFLVLRRSDTDTSRNGEWDLAGGMVDEDETIREGALREVEEETGLTKILGCKLLFTASGVSFSETDQEHLNYIFLYYFIEVEGNEDIKLSYEHDSYEWVDQEKLQSYLTHRAQSAAFTHIFSNKLDV